jgi:hypothetical protein
MPRSNPVIQPPVTSQQMREIAQWIRQVSGVVVVPSFDGQHWIGTIEKLDLLADWIDALDVLDAHHSSDVPKGAK